MKVTTNNKVRYGKYYPYDMTKKEKRQVESAYGGLITLEDSEFVFYRGHPYYMGDCMKLEKNTAFKGWDGYFGDTFFSIVLVKIDDSCDGYIFGFYYS